MCVIDKCDEAFLQSCSRMEILQSWYGDDLEMHAYCWDEQLCVLCGKATRYMYSVCRSATDADCIL